MIDALVDLQPRQLRAIEALLVTPTTADAARESGVPARTLARWLRQESFRAALGAVRRESMRAAMGKVQRVASKAVDALEAALADTAAGVRIQAATVILSHAVRAAELQDLQERLDKLEALAKARGGLQ